MDDAAADAGAEDHAEHHAPAGARAVARFREREAVGVVVDPDLAAERARQVLGERTAVELGRVGVLDPARDRRDRARRADADPAARAELALERVDQPAHGVDRQRVVVRRRGDAAPRQLAGRRRRARSPRSWCRRGRRRSGSWRASPRRDVGPRDASAPRGSARPSRRRPSACCRARGRTIPGRPARRRSGKTTTPSNGATTAVPSPRVPMRSPAPTRSKLFQALTKASPSLGPVDDLAQAQRLDARALAGDRRRRSGRGARAC